MIIVGIDPSLASTGICAVNSMGTLLSCEAVQSKFTGAKRLSDIKEQMIPKVFYVGKEKTIVFIEGYAYGAKNNREVMGELGGVIRLMLFEQDIEYVVVAPTALKKFTTGKGNADKIAMGVAVMEYWDKKFPTSDQSDAFALCQFGLVYMGLKCDLPAFRQEVIDDMKNPKVKKRAKK